ncbi:ABC transporter permease [Actinomadura harenae]|uniref:FtsX-like permease family protein n=1 Tax=Actinomadura harenae TaxID=2483351 RepID=A0A3M2LSX0_9ACTN|nr:ABC transporter permease [Actinomadura harenae]RMI40579.1 FtsX-like permease family protein [Actinomadura harenae]
MIGLAFRELWGRRRRLTSSLVAVFLGVAFLTGTLALGDTLSRAIDRYYANSNGHTDVMIRNATQVSKSPGDLPGEIDGAVLARVKGVPGVADAQPVIQGSGQPLGRDGKVIPERGPRIAGNWIEDPRLNAYRITQGRAPRAPDEVVINKRAADHGKLRVGDRTVVLTPERVPVTVVGISMFGKDPAFGETAFTAFSLEGAQRYVAHGTGRLTGVALRAAPGVGQGELAARASRVLPAGTEAITGKALVAEGIGQVRDVFVKTFQTALGAFGAVALLVAAFSIHNTFTITLAQRTRESALLRAVGASRRQLAGLVGAEALVVGGLATAAGIAGGAGCAFLLKLVFSGFGMGLDAQGVVLTARTVLIAAPVGLVVTLLAVLGPAVRAVRIPPIAAMRESAAEPAGVSETRVIVGSVVAAVGIGAVVFGAVIGRGAWTGVGALMSLAAMVVLGPVVARPAATLIGMPAARFRGVSGRLARENAVRSPRRTAGAATALMIGVGVVTLLTVFAGSLRASLADGVAGSFRSGLVVNGGTNETGGFEPSLATQAASLPQIATAVGLGKGAARVDGHAATVGVADPALLGRVLSLDVTSGTLPSDPASAGSTPAAAGSGSAAAGGGAAVLAVGKKVADQRKWKVGTVVTVTFSDGSRVPMTVAAIYKRTDLSGEYLVPRTAWAAHNRRPLDTAVFATSKQGVSEADARAALTSLVRSYGAPEVQNRSEYVTAQTKQMNAFLGIVYVMLALAILIALLGIANTLALSVHERTRELGLLRAVGATRGQVRAMIRWESLIVSLFGTAGGAGFGLFLGWALVSALSDPFSVPVVPLVVILLVGAVAGVLAALRPARRAARLPALTAVASG